MQLEISMFSTQFELNGGTHDAPCASICHPSKNVNSVLPSHDNYISQLASCLSSTTNNLKMIRLQKTHSVD